MMTYPKPGDLGREPIVRHINGILLLAIGLALAGCGEEDRMAPPSEGTLVVATSTQGDDPDQDGYRLTVDSKENIGLVPTGTKEIRLAFGRHRLQLVGVAEQCTVAEGDERVVDVPSSQGTIAVTFEVHCAGPLPMPPPVAKSGTFRITAPTTGSVPESTRYSLWYAHFDYWGDSCCEFAELATLDPNGTFIVRVEPSRESGADPYWYKFFLEDVPGNCSVRDPTPVGFSVLPGKTVDVELAVTCSP